MPQTVEVDLDVLSGRRGATMTEMVTDLLEGEASSQQLSGTGMSQAMGATPRGLDAESGQARTHNGTDAGRQKGANGRVKTQKQLAMNASWPRFLHPSADDAATQGCEPSVSAQAMNFRATLRPRVTPAWLSIS